MEPTPTPATDPTLKYPAPLNRGRGVEPDYRAAYRALLKGADPLAVLGGLPLTLRHVGAGHPDLADGRSMAASYWRARGLLEATDPDDRRKGGLQVLALMALADYLDGYGGPMDVELKTEEGIVTRTVPHFIVRSGGYRPEEISISWYRAVNLSDIDWASEPTVLARNGEQTSNPFEAVKHTAESYGKNGANLDYQAFVYVPHMHGAAIYRGTDHVNPDHRFGEVWSVHT